MKKAAFLDRDGVINHDYGYVYNIAQFDFIDGVIDACQKLQLAGYELVVVTNQSGIARGYYTESQLNELHQWMRHQFANERVKINAIYHCPHHIDGKLETYSTSCKCRKPEAGMLLQAAKDLDLDLSKSILFGDKKSDIQAGSSAGLKTLIKIGDDDAESDVICHSLIDGVEQYLTSVLDK